MKFPKHIAGVILSALVASRASAEIPYMEGEMNPAKWPAVHLQLSAQGTLKEIFDSGLRPWRVPALEMVKLEAKHVRLSAVLGSGITLPAFDAETMDISPFEGGDLCVLKARTPTLSIAEAREAISPWLPRGKHDKTEVEHFFKAVEADYLDFDNPNHGIEHGCLVQWREPGAGTSGGGPIVSVKFRKAFSPGKPLILDMLISWNQNRRQADRKLYEIPIPPPPGYGHVSMAAPKTFGPDPSPSLPAEESYPLPPSLQPSLQVTDNPPSPPVSGTQPQSGKSGFPRYLPWLAAFFLGAALLLIVKQLKSPQAPRD